MNRPDDRDELLRQERDIRARLADQQFDFEAGQAIQNIYRAASAVRLRAQRDLLADIGITWGGFTLLWVLWVWGTMDSSTLAGECGVAKGTLTGLVTTLERRDLVVRGPDALDRRRVVVSLTDAGEALIAQLYPRFNAVETSLVSGLSDGETNELARLLRRVITNATA